MTEEEVEKPLWQLPETLPVDGDWFWWASLWASKPQLGIGRTGSDRQIQEINMRMTWSSALNLSVHLLPLRECQGCIWMMGVHNVLLTYAWHEYHCLFHNPQKHSPKMYHTKASVNTAGYVKFHQDSKSVLTEFCTGNLAFPSRGIWNAARVEGLVIAGFEWTVRY